MTYDFRRPPYLIGSAIPLAQSHVDELLACFESSEKTENQVFPEEPASKKII
jgi:hypothetical protein